MKIITLGISYHKTPIEFREKVFFRKEALPLALTALKEAKEIKECVILSTCNRTEIYIVTDNLMGGKETLEKFISNYHQVKIEELKLYLWEKKDKEAMEHLIKVASGLDSMVLGEQQILGQVKEAYQIALENKTTAFIFNILFQKVLSIAKKIRTDTTIGEGAISISYAAVELAKRIFNDLNDKKVMIIGTGKMGELLIKHLVDNGIKQLLVVNRDLKKATELAEKFKGRAVSFDQLYKNIPLVDIVITSTNSPHYVIKMDHIKDILKRRKNKIIFLIDIGLPRNIEPEVNSLESLILYNLDDLKVVVEANKRARSKKVKAAEKIINQELPEIISWYRSLEFVPLIHEIKKKIEEICRRELLKIQTFLDEKSREKHIKSISNKILALPMSKIKEAISSGDGYVYLKTLKELFQIEEKVK
ncbi:glutamyl-tRNA reductase [bacterium]|nr:glutamyl-tRNA reductase [bacterium]MBU0899235.1 glutamyl-tRNA reductase [bacterium]MBU1152659.1 glutamyl-tRNA reductase [bacterium]MBU2600417.1 glutamyl-tRNA reductase [bacterium]